MNSKIEKINEYLIKNQLVADGRDIEGDPQHTMIISVDSVHDFGFYLFVGDEPIVGCKCLITGEVNPETPGLLLLLNKLSCKYKTHSYRVDENGFLTAEFPMYFTDDAFSAEDLFGYCSLVDHYVAEDVPEIFALLGREVPEAVLNGGQQEDIVAEQSAENVTGSVNEVPVAFDTPEAPEGSEASAALMDIDIPSAPFVSSGSAGSEALIDIDIPAGSAAPSGSVGSENANEVKNID